MFGRRPTPNNGAAANGAAGQPRPAAPRGGNGLGTARPDRAFGRQGATLDFPPGGPAETADAPFPGSQFSPEAIPVPGDINASASGRAAEERSGSRVDQAIEILEPVMRARFDANVARRLPRREVASDIADMVDAAVQTRNLDLSDGDKRDIVTVLLNLLFADAPAEDDPLAPSLSPAPEEASRESPAAQRANRIRSTVAEAKGRIQNVLLERIDASAASKLSRGELARQVSEVVSEILVEQEIRLNSAEQRDLVTMLLNDMLGLGPLEPLLADEAVTDIMVNGPYQVYVERKGKLELTDVKFRDNSHVMNIATRIVTRIGRRIDESSPLVDARLQDGSRVNVIAPPLAIDGASISIRKFAKQKITLDRMVEQNNLSANIARVLKIAARCRLNILISGGTGSGKTTLLNAMSQMIDVGERIVTIEDAAELQLQQPHVVRLETRPPNLEGHGEVTMRDLVKNALRMRPDRIILGEIRGSEAIDVLQAMNTGHEGSMSTIHANKPREALTRLENMIGMAGLHLPGHAMRTQIASALDLIVQVSRMRDGMRRIVNVMEVVGMEGDVITTQDLFFYRYERDGDDGKLIGRFDSTGLRPVFLPKAAYYGLDKALVEAV